MTQQDTIKALKDLLAKHGVNLRDLDVEGYILDAISDAEYVYNIPKEDVTSSYFAMIDLRGEE